MEHVEQDLPDLLQDDLPDSERRRIERHLSACPSCREAWEAISVLRESSLRDHANVPEGYFATLPARILQRRTRPSRRRWPRLAFGSARVLLPVAAGALAIVWLVNTSSPIPERTGRLAVPASDAAEYLASDPVLSSTELSAAVEPIVASRAIVVPGDGADEIGIEDLEPLTVTEVVAELNESEIDALITKLSEREIL